MRDATEIMEIFDTLTAEQQRAFVEYLRSLKEKE